MERKLKDKNILITGASRGIGRVTAEYLAEMGARLILHYNKNEEAGTSLLKALPGKGHTLLQADFSKAVDFNSLIKTCIGETGQIHALVNNAGVYLEKKFDNLDFDHWKDIWETTISVNLTSVAHLSFVVSKHMVAIGGGKIINISSRGAFRGEPNALAYGASKAGLNSLGQSMAQALAPHNIFVYTLAPGFVETEMAQVALDSPIGPSIKAQSPLNRVAQPIEIARTIGFLLSEENEFLTGSIIDINGASYLRS
ncbi:MAG: SDR family oxidoreductase [Bacteroidales bacterium]|nr:SDR family oxidoreductase [Bacteroidales bacterium]MCF8456363.1 SDR family oxidoreductase [Bacteroidales bacterium]